MRHGNKEKWKTTHGGSNGTTKSRKNLNTRRKGNLQILGNMSPSNEGRWKKKIKKEYLRSYSKSN